MAGWPSKKKVMNSRPLDESNDMLTGALLSQKSGVDLLQNCDLPPPSKVFSGSDKTVISSMDRIFSLMGRGEDGDDFDVWRGVGGGGDDQNDKVELLRALRLSQTRAREAERKAESLAKEKDSLFNALFQESLQLYAYRQWVRLLEAQVAKLRSQWQSEEKDLCCGCGRSEKFKKLSEEGSDSEDGVRLSWFVTFCLGIAGVGLVFGCSYLF